MSDDVTRTATEHGLGAVVADRVPVLTVVHHSDPALVGRRRLLEPGATVLVGRKQDVFGPGVLDGSKISRRHAEIRRRGERVQVEDLGSSNGTTVDGEPVQARDLAPGDAIGIGDVVLLFHREPALHTPPAHPTLLGISAPLADLVAQIELVGPRAIPVTLQGESGTGKELVARALHDASGRTGAFVAVNCGAIGDGVVQSELFGHERGAFSGAERARAGLVARASRGTPFLDEVGDASPALQVSLLRLLQEGEARSVGADTARKVDVRIVAASHVDLREAVDDGRFRKDLFGRLNRWVIEVPALRDRPVDVLPLARAFATELAGRPVGLSKALAIALQTYPWPGNVRELRATVERLVVEAAGALTLELTPWAVKALAPPAEPAPIAPTPTGKPERAELVALLQRANGNVKALATHLGVGRTTLYRWFKEYDLDPKDLR